MYKSLKKRDGHMHTPFCPHGSKDSLESYIEIALEEGREEITFTEHFPMPEGIATPEFQRECTLQEEEISEYIATIQCVKNQYKERIRINIGFEVDYIEEYDEIIKENLNIYGKEMEDGILSVHFVKFENQYYAIDYLPDFEALFHKTQSLEKIYDLYYETILKSIQADLGDYKPNRIGHISLVRIFNQKYPFHYKNEELIRKIVLEIKQRNFEIDFNIAGLRKVYCKETYPSGQFLEYIKQERIPIIIGSDAHSAEQVKLDLLF